MSIKELWNKYKELIFYMVFGAGTTAVNIIAFVIFTRVIFFTDNDDFNVMVANVIAWILSVLFAYVTNKLWVFNSKAVGITLLKEAFAFFACRFASLLMDLVVVFVGYTMLGFGDVPVKLVSNIFVIIFNYVFSKFFIFKKEEN